MRNRETRMLIGCVVAALAGIVVLFAAASWYAWRESLAVEERRVGDLARALGQRTEEMVFNAYSMLVEFNELEAPRCSTQHLRAMHDAAIEYPHIRAIGYWQAAERRCGVGFIQSIDLRPARADRIYDSGVIAWWPSPQTEVGGVQLFLMRYGAHDIAIDPRLLLEAGPMQQRRAGLWVENLRMATTPADAELPNPESVPVGLTVDQENQQIISRFSIGTIFPIDVVAVEPIGRFWDRHWPTLAAAGIVCAILVIVWIHIVVRYSRRRLSLSAELEEALANGSLAVAYQPIVDLASGRCVGAEALARWVREDGSPVSPEVFIPVAEAVGLAPEITRAVLAATLRDLGALLRTDGDLRININLAPEDLDGDAFAGTLAEGIRSAGVPAARIKLEITERALIDHDEARERVRAFRERGHSVAIDDFGTGYSSLAYLESFELDTLKIDKSFVDVIETEAVTSQVIEHIIEMARSLGLYTVAEGIESSEQLDWLRDQGVDAGQGYLYSRSLSAGEFREFVLARNGV